VRSRVRVLVDEGFGHRHRDHPGVTGKSIDVTLTNTGKGTINVTALTPSASTVPGCTTSYVSFTRSATTPLPSALGSTPATVTFTVAMDPNAESGCAGKAFTVNFSATGTVG
jgi:hypothetical protein